MSGFKIKIAIVGISGMIGQKLKKYFEDKKYDVVGVKIRDNTDIEDLVKDLEHCDVVINLSGATILSRWSKSYKKTLYSSRIETTKKLVFAMKRCSDKAKLLLSASAVGIYDSQNSHNEDSLEFADDFLSQICRDWEAEALKANQFGVRVVTMRLGVVYAKEGGAMQKMLPPFRFGLGGAIGQGEQIISWIHIDDLIRAVDFIIKNPDISGSVNFSSPESLSNLEQTKIMGEVLNRPTIFTIPPFILKLIFGEGACVMLDSKDVYPKKLLENGYKFLFSDFKSAFKDIVK
ncbi:MAG: TIGR01777 family oxidoreductase [Sulfurimonas sp.]|nr:TIGR01777 family oxidoreductase [Sulfurimonas sp.]